MSRIQLKLMALGLALFPLFIAFQNFSDGNPMMGNVDGITYAANGTPQISGWTCQQTNSAIIQTNVYLGGAYGNGGASLTIVQHS